MKVLLTKFFGLVFGLYSPDRDYVYDNDALVNRESRSIGQSTRKLDRYDTNKVVKHSSAAEDAPKKPGMRSINETLEEMIRRRIHKDRIVGVDNYNQWSQLNNEAIR